MKDVQLFKGGFSSIYGGRLSSVTEINGKDGDRKNFNFGVDLSLLSINMFMETPINKNSSLLIAFRRSYQGPLYDKIFQQLIPLQYKAAGLVVVAPVVDLVDFRNLLYRHRIFMIWMLGTIIISIK